MINSHPSSNTSTPPVSFQDDDGYGYVPPPTDRNRADYYTSDPEDQRKFQEWAERLQLALPDLAVFCKHGFSYETIPVNSANRRALLSHLKRIKTTPSRWVMISGLFPDIDFSEPERRKRLRALHKALVLLIKRSLAREAADPLCAERSIFWDPVAEVCRDLDVAPSKLSALMKEFCGHSLTQLIDCVRAEKIQKMLRGQIRQFIGEWKAHRATLAAEDQEEITPFAVWKALKATRKWPEYCQNSWAQGFGFSTYRRMYRACVAVWKQTPHQLEMKLIAEELKGSENSLTDGNLADAEPKLSEIEEGVRGIRSYADES